MLIFAYALDSVRVTSTLFGKPAFSVSTFQPAQRTFHDIYSILKKLPGIFHDYKIISIILLYTVFEQLIFPQDFCISQDF